MLGIVSTLLGGIGLFLLGMILMTEGLKALAGDALRRMLARFTGTRVSALLTGAGVTALVQSSSATTLATIGFVSAGLLSLENAIGVIIGANLGTTSTGWIVSLLGLKLSVGKLAMPLIGIGALCRLLGRAQLAQSGLALAGFGVIFVGIDTLQAGMAGIADRFDLARYGAETLGARALLVLIGLIMTVVMQSSSAAVATTLTALASGTIAVDQAAALVIGQNVGTTVTALLASIGASAAARRTAFVHLSFNLGTGAIAFLTLPLFTHWIAGLVADFAGEDHALTIAAFHTAFNLLGALIFVPLTPWLARLAERLVRERRSALVSVLDPTLLQVPSLAVDAAAQALRRCALGVFEDLVQRLQDASSRKPSQSEDVPAAIETVARFLEGLPQVGGASLARLSSSLHLLDHLRQLAHEAGKDARYGVALRVAALRWRAAELAAELGDGLRGLRGELALRQCAEHLLDGSRVGADARPAILQAASARQLEIDDSLEALAAQRWLERIAHHAGRALHYLDQLDEDSPQRPAVAAPDESSPSR